jgi:hypothetical protein
VLAAGCAENPGSDHEEAPDNVVTGGGTFGQTGTGTGFSGMSADGKRASAFTLSDNSVTVTKLTAYLDGRGRTSGSQVGRGVIYAADGAGGAPGTLLCQTAEFSVAAGQASSWVSMTISGTCTLAASGKYYLGIHTGATAGVARYGSYSVTGALHWSLNDAYSDGPSTSWGTDSLANSEMAIYATYTASTGGTDTYEAAISYTQTRLAFTPTRTINVSNGTELKTAISNLQPGDLVKASAPFTYTGTSSSSSAIVIAKQLSSPAVIDLTGIAIVYAGGGYAAAVYIRNASNIRLYGGDVSTNGTGGCIDDVGSQNVLWWGFNVHDCGGSGVGMVPGLAVIDHTDFQGSITGIGENLAQDPHAEKGTGVHGAILWDANNSTYGFTNNRIAFDVQNIKYGACIELGSDYTVPAGGNTMYARCVGNPCQATSQTCGNGIELWGYTSTLGLDVKYLQVDNYAGYAIETALRSGQNLDGVKVEYGRASNDMTAPYPAGRPLWDHSHGIIYQNVLPAP